MNECFLIWVDLPFACFGLVVDDNLRVTRAAPIAKYAVGWSGARAKNYFRGRGATVKILAVAERM